MRPQKYSTCPASVLTTLDRNEWTSPLWRGKLFAHVSDRELKESRKRMMDRAAFDARLLCFPAPSTTCREDYPALLTSPTAAFNIEEQVISKKFTFSYLLSVSVHCCPPQPAGDLPAHSTLPR